MIYPPFSLQIVLASVTSTTAAIASAAPTASTAAASTTSIKCLSDHFLSSFLFREKWVVVLFSIKYEGGDKLVNV